MTAWMSRSGDPHRHRTGNTDPTAIRWPTIRTTRVSFSTDRFAGDLKNHASSTRTRVEIHKDDLLPGTEQRPAFAERDHQRWPEQRSPHVAGTVVVPPRGVVMVVASFRDEFFEELIQITDQTRLEFDGGDARRRTRHEDEDVAFMKPTLSYRRDKIRCDVMHIAMADRFEHKICCSNHPSPL